jgi:hypothetical protein
VLRGTFQVIQAQQSFYGAYGPGPFGAQTGNALGYPDPPGYGSNRTSYGGHPPPYATQYPGGYVEIP